MGKPMGNVRRLPAALALLVVAVGGVGLLAAPIPLGAGKTSVPRCRAQQLDMSGHFLGDADLMFTATFTFTNASQRVCDLTGWPTVRLRSVSGKPQHVRTERVLQGLSLASVHPVALASGGAASFDLYGADFNDVADKSCPTTSVIFVTPPGDATALKATMHLPNCGLLPISPMITGKVDREAWSIRAATLCGACRAYSPRAARTGRSCVPTAHRRCQLDVLRPNSIANLKLGASPASARAAIDALLHQTGGPSQRSGSCSVHHEITWQDQWTANGEPSLTLYFGHTGLVGYQVGAPQEPRRPTGGWMLATARGLHVGDPLSTGRRLYGSSIALSANQGGVWLIRSASGELDGYAWGTNSGRSDVGWSSLVASIDAGDVGCPAAGP